MLQHLWSALQWQPASEVQGGHAWQLVSGHAASPQRLVKGPGGSVGIAGLTGGTCFWELVVG